MTFTIAGNTYNVQATQVNSNWTGSVNAGYDIGLAELTSPVLNVNPATLYTGTAENHQIGTIVGYGATGTGLTGAVQSAGTDRAGTNVLSLGSALNSISWSGGGNDTILVADFDAPGQTGDPTTNLAVPTSLEYCAAPGDSGGGWFMDVGGTQEVVGVTSFLLENPANFAQAQYGDICGATRVSSYLSWISGYAKYNVANWTADFNHDGIVDVVDLGILASDWKKTGMIFSQGDTNSDSKVDVVDLGTLATYWQKTNSTDVVPEPASMALLSIVGLLMLRRRN